MATVRQADPVKGTTRAVTPETDAERIDRLEQSVLFLAAELARYRTEQCMVRSFEDIWASTYPGHLATSAPRPQARHLHSVSDSAS